MLIDRNIPAVVLRFLLSLYTVHISHVEWNGCSSQWFLVQNGVKQSGVLSPILFCIYMDGLLNKLYSSRIGCCIGSHFCGALAYADDSFIGPTQQLGLCAQCLKFSKTMLRTLI